jgi:shikimate dehydrogenase
VTRLFGVIGCPVGHSLSPAMHTAAFQALRLDACYLAIEVPPRFLRPMLRALVLAGVEGLNVTVPLKEAILPLLDRVDPDARALGAVNTVVIRNRMLTGYNTDGAGFGRALDDVTRRRVRRAVVLGAGGAARAVAWELLRRGTHVVIANRHPARAQALAARLRRLRSSARVEAVGLRNVRLDAADLLVNATTLGMRARDPMPVAPTTLRGGLAVYDLVYNRPTPLVEAARRRGCVAAGGLSMLLYQGAEALRLWLHRPPPVDAMRRALRRAVRG